MSEKQIRFTLRIVPELDEKLKAISKKQGFSKNTIIVQALWSHIEKLKAKKK